MPESASADEVHQALSRIKARQPKVKADLDRLESLLAEKIDDIPADVRASLEASLKLGRDNHAFWTGFFAEAKEIN